MKWKGRRMKWKGEEVGASDKMTGDGQISY